MKPTHYETLGLKECCSAEEVRSSFVTLSKKYHPDKDSKNPGLHAKFVSINEAYSILSKPVLRRNYDFDLRTARAIAAQRKYNGFSASDDRMYQPHSAWRDESIWSMRDRRKDKGPNDSSYYGIKGVTRKPNSWVALGACALMLAGAVVHYVHYKHSRVFTITRLDRKDRILSEHLEEARNRAKANGKELQMEIFLQRVESSKNGID